MAFVIKEYLGYDLSKNISNGKEVKNMACGSSKKSSSKKSTKKTSKGGKKMLIQGSVLY